MPPSHISVFTPTVVMSSSFDPRTPAMALADGDELVYLEKLSSYYKRTESVNKVFASDYYRKAAEKAGGNLPPSPEPGEVTSKRRWEAAMAAWRQALRVLSD